MIKREVHENIVLIDFTINNKVQWREMAIIKRGGIFLYKFPNVHIVVNHFAE